MGKNTYALKMVVLLFDFLFAHINKYMSIFHFLMNAFLCVICM